MIARLTFALAIGGMILPLPALADAGGGQAPAARANDAHYFGGLWQVERFIPFVDNATPVPEQQARMDHYKAVQKDGQILYSAWTSCRPGSPSTMVTPMMSLIILQKEADITLSFEEPRLTRRVRMNAEHPAHPKPSYAGDSIGRWDGNTLVIDTIGYNGDFQLDSAGLGTSPQLHTTERWTKSPDGKRIDVETTIEDPVYYSKPFVLKRAWLVLDADAPRQQNEYDCSENPREEEFAHTYFIKDLYRPTCVRYEGKGDDPSRILCRRPREAEERHD